MPWFYNNKKTSNSLEKFTQTFVFLSVPRLIRRSVAQPVGNDSRIGPNICSMQTKSRENRRRVKKNTSDKGFVYLLRDIFFVFSGAPGIDMQYNQPLNPSSERYTCVFCLIDESYNAPCDCKADTSGNATYILQPIHNQSQSISTWLLRRRGPI